MLHLRHLAGCLLAAAAAAQQSSGEAPVDDGWPDLSSFLDESYGFLPIAMPITDPAVGYGVMGGLMFLSKSLGEARAGRGRPDITFVGGLVTENGTQGAAIADARYWLDDRLRTRVFAIDASVNLDFYGVGDDATLADDPLRYNLDPFGMNLGADYRLGDSLWWIGLDYTLSRVDVAFENTTGSPALPSFETTSEIGGVRPGLTYDSRDNVFTPTDGVFASVSAGLFDPSLGGDAEFQRVDLTGLYYLPLAEDWFLGVRGEGVASFGDVPFYLRPFVTLRGVPSMRYQGESVVSLEVELRWRFWERFSLIGFGGTGLAWNDLDRVDNRTDVWSGGTGFRYELAREYGIHAGIDVAWGPEDTVFYLQVGSAWARP